MKTGKCSKHPHVVHQYAQCKSPQCNQPKNVKRSTRFGGAGSTAEHFDAKFDDLAAKEGLCTGGKLYPGIDVHGPVAASAIVENASQCCLKAREVGLRIKLNPLFTFKPDGNCTVFSYYTGVKNNLNDTSGSVVVFPPKPSVPSDFTDLFGDSCLNGWTMGNIAATTRDVARFFFLLAKAKLTSAASLADMRTYHNLTQGFGAGRGSYGLGLLNLSFRGGPQRDSTGATVNWTDSWGHLGEDWGSEIQYNGYYPNLGVSMAMATNANRPMNFTGNQSEYGNQPALYCRLESAVLEFLHPDAPALAC
jgi:hypothetical protein